MGEHDGHRNRLRQRFLKDGLDHLTDDQVLELLLFYAMPRRDTNPLARKLLAHFGSLSAVLDASYHELMEVEGMGEQTATLVHLVTPISRRYLMGRSQQNKIITSTQICGEYLLPYFYGSKDELIYLLCLDAKKKVLLCRLLQHGSIHSASFSIRNAVSTAMSCNATFVVLAHNHTSGVALPSQADITTTQYLREAMQALDIILIDHIIVADNDFVSMAENGYFLRP